MYIAIGLGVLMVIWVLFSWLAIRNVEEPVYTLKEKRDGYELRTYDSYIIARTWVSSGSHNNAANNAFGIIADYIFGNNSILEKIAMTIPVTSQESEKEIVDEPISEKIAMTKPVVTESSDIGMFVSFIMPNSYTLETLPKPNSDKVEIVEEPEKIMAVYSFNGWYATDERISRAIESLQLKLEQDGVEVIGDPQVARYNPPFTIPFILRNEILIEVR